MHEEAGSSHKEWCLALPAEDIIIISMGCVCTVVMHMHMGGHVKPYGGYRVWITKYVFASSVIIQCVFLCVCVCICTTLCCFSHMCTERCQVRTAALSDWLEPSEAWQGCKLPRLGLQLCLQLVMTAVSKETTPPPTPPHPLLHPDYWLYSHLFCNSPTVSLYSHKFLMMLILTPSKLKYIIYYLFIWYIYIWKYFFCYTIIIYFNFYVWNACRLYHHVSSDCLWPFMVDIVYLLLEDSAGVLLHCVMKND